ncbi:MAG: AAA family ATPase [Butyribacter sp.]|jgi:cytidylate kinase|uniref:cytidylate kinase-like family protein n=1 Tax=Butyribacter TaxID=2822463 RepID=UPI00384831C8|nr:cytidylate kinase-like family protein [Clostridium sp.]MCQ5167266.1 cytidylate kinase-like family protein [Roseburia hominis]
MNHFVVAIGREFGAQGCDIAEKLAEKLGVKLYDRQLVEEAAKKLEMDEHTVQKADEVSAKDIEGLKTTYGIGNFYLSTQVLDAQADIIERVAQNESCIIMGRCADYILKDRDDCLKIYIYAPFDVRTKHIAEKYDMSMFSAKRLVRQMDEKRDTYYKYVTGNRRGEHDGKDAMFDSSIMGVDGTVDMLLEMINKKFG